MSADDSAQLAANVAASVARGGLDDLAAALPSLRHLLRSPTLPLPELLYALDGRSDEAALARRAADPNEAPALLVVLAGAFPAAFCANPALPLLLLENPALPATFDPVAAGLLLRYPGVPRELLAAFAALGAPEAAHAARLHVGLAGEAGAEWEAELRETVLALPIAPDDDLAAVLLALGAVPPWLAPRVTPAGEPPAAAVPKKSSALSAPSASSADLARLLESENPAERALAAADPRVPPALLVAAKAAEDVTDVDYDVYEALAANPAAPPELLLELVRDRTALNTRTRRLVARHPAAPPEALALLADEPYAADIRLILAAHPNLAPAQRDLLFANSLAQALATPDPLCHAVALAHPSAPEDALADYAEAPAWLERVAVALNPRTPPAVRKALAEDGNRLVRAAARATEYP